MMHFIKTDVFIPIITIIGGALKTLPHFYCNEVEKKEVKLNVPLTKYTTDTSTNHSPWLPNDLHKYIYCV